MKLICSKAEFWEVCYPRNFYSKLILFVWIGLRPNFVLKRRRFVTVNSGVRSASDKMYSFIKPSLNSYI